MLRLKTTTYAKCIKEEVASVPVGDFFFPGSYVLFRFVFILSFAFILNPVGAEEDSTKLHLPLPQIVQTAETPATIDYSTAEQSAGFPSCLVEKLNRSRAIELETLQTCTDSILRNINGVVYHLDRSETAEAETFLNRLVPEVLQWSELRNQLKISDAETTDGVSDVFLEEVFLALERRILLWQLVVQVTRVAGHPLTDHFSKSGTDVQRLKDKTLDVEAYFLDDSTKNGKRSGRRSETAKKDEAGAHWCEYLDTRSFIVELEACERSIHSPNKRVSTEVSGIPIPPLVSFCDRANVILARLDDQGLSKMQKAYLDAPVVQAWREELRNWTADTVPSTTLLRAVERYEATGGMSDMQNLFRLATRQSFAPTPELRRLGLFTRDLYGLPNVKLYISRALINNHLPPMKPESAPFRETIQGQPTRGHRQAESSLAIRLLPDEERLRLSLDLDVNIETNSRSSAFATTLFNSGQAQVEASREIELTDTGFHLAPSRVRVVHNRLHLRRFQTDFDRIPLLSGLVRGVVRNQYDAKIAGARNETQLKIARQVRTRLEKETEERFEAINERYREFLDNSTKRFDLFIEQKDAKTETDWLLTSWAIRSQDCLSGNTPAPETMPGSFADLKIHESAINMIVGKLQLDGKSGTVAELRKEIAEKFNRPELDVPGDNDDVTVVFANYNPIVVRFVDGKIEMAVSLQSLRLRGKTHRDFKVLVRYEPGTDSEGRLVLKRNGVISLIGCPRIGDQIAVRAAFGVIFPEDRTVPLSPKFLESDPDFRYLATDHCRIEKGWFAVALVAKEDPNGLRQARR